MAALTAIFLYRPPPPLIHTALPLSGEWEEPMNYWSELGWMVVPMSGIEIGFALLMCYISQAMDRKKG